MLKKILAGVTTALLAVGLSVIAVAAPASATAYPPTGSSANQPENWQVLEGEVCSKIDSPPAVPFILPAPPTGYQWSKIITKAGSGDDANTIHLAGSGSATNTVYHESLVQGTAVQHATKDSISHVILCATPVPFTWDWQYAAPTCDALTVVYPVNIPSGQANDVNVRIVYGAGFSQTITLNFHNNTGTWSGTKSFTYSTHPNWPSNIGPYKVVWTQVGGTNYHWQGEVTCGTTPQDAAAALIFTAPTCTAGQGVALGAITNATWGELVISGLSYSVTATATAGHLFAGGAATKTFQGTLLGPDTSLCEPDLECLPRSAVSYTYIAATNSGVITVVNPNPATYSNELCQGFWVTATSWKYTSTDKWPQVRDIVQKLPKITSVGTYPYAAAVGCGQGDIYASFNAQPDPTEWLYGPSNPFPETFLHNMGFTGPQPTWVQTAPGCNQVPVEVPVPHAITECGTIGSISIPTSDYATYTLTGNGTSGINTVTAEAVAPYVLQGYPVGGWTFDLGDYTDCELQLQISYVRDCAVDATNTWRVYNPGEETVVVTYGAGLTHQATPGYSTFETPRADETMVISWGADGSGLAPGTATAASGDDYTGADEPCLTEPDVSSVTGECVYDTSAAASPVTVSITYDNTGSNVPVTFSLVGFAGAYDRTVGAGESYTFSGPNAPSTGGTFTVTAAGKTFTIDVPACPTYDKPEPVKRDEVVPSYDCTTVVVTLTTTTYTTDWVFDPATLEWVKGEEVASAPVVTTRAMTPEEIAQEVCLVVATDPQASTCEATADTQFTSWIRVALNDNIEYRIDGELVTTEFTEVTPGEHTVTATALNGYTLQGAQPEPDDWTDTEHTWTFTAVDSATECGPALEGSFATGVCKADAPWIDWSIAMSDPYNRATSHHAYLVLTNGTDTETLDLGELVYNATTEKWELTGSTLWPGASVDGEGNATGWPGWEQLPDGTWQTTTGNFAWVRDITTATVVVNPDLTVDLAYPDATPDCAGPEENPTLAQVLPSFSSTQMTCTTAGSYTIGAEFGDVSWTVNGVPTPAGTYPVTTPGTVTLVATPTDPEDGFDDTWVDEPIVLAFATPEGGCASLLALTGAATSFGAVWAAIVLALTGVGIMLIRRRPAAR